jgi:hypothetical protein
VTETKTKTYNARLATRLTSSVDSRLRQFALLRRRRISHLLDEVLDQALPTTQDLAGQFAGLADTTPEHSPAIAPPSAGTGNAATTTATPTPRHPAA